MKSWRLNNADEIAAQNKYTFYKPSRALIAGLKSKDIVKLIFAYDTANPDGWTAERMWVEIDDVNADGSFIGRLANDPKWIADLKLDDVIAFDASHIINIHGIEAGQDCLVNKFSMRCFVTSRILNDGAPVAHLYREAPERDNDSGWRIFAGDESDEYFSVEENVHYVSLGAVLSTDDSFVHLLDQPVGTQCEIDESTGRFIILPCEESN